MEPKTWRYDLSAEVMRAQDRRVWRRFLSNGAIVNTLVYFSVPTFLTITLATMIRGRPYSQEDLDLAFTSACIAFAFGYAYHIYAYYAQLKAHAVKTNRTAVELTITEQGMSWSWAGENVSADWTDIVLTYSGKDEVHVNVGPIPRTFIRSLTNDEATQLIERFAQKAK